MLELSVGPRSVVLDTERLRVKTDSMDTEKVKSILKSWYIRQAEDCLLGRTQHFSSRLGVKPSRVQLRQYRSQWGRCNSRQNGLRLAGDYGPRFCDRLFGDTRVVSHQAL